eukprot:gene6272-24393_t
MAAASSNDAGASDPSAPPPQRRVRFQAKFHNQKRVIEVEGLANTTKELMALVLPLLDPLEKAQLILYWNTNTAQTTAQRGTPVISWAMRHDPIHWNPVDVGESNLLEMNTYHGDANSILPPSFFKAKMVWFGYRLCGVVVKGCKCWMLLQRKGKASDEGADGVSATPAGEGAREGGAAGSDTSGLPRPRVRRAQSAASLAASQAALARSTSKTSTSASSLAPCPPSTPAPSLPFAPTASSSILDPFLGMLAPASTVLLPSSSDDDDDEHTNSRLLPEEVRRKARRVLTEDGESIFQYSMNMPHPILEPHVLLANANGGSNHVQSTFVGLDFESELDKLLPSLELLNSNDGFGFEAISAGMPYNGSIWLSLRFTPPPHIGAKEMPFLVLYCQSKLFWDAMHTYLEEVQPAPSWGVVWDPHNVKVFLEENSNNQVMHLHLRIVRICLGNTIDSNAGSDRAQQQQQNELVFVEASLNNAGHEEVAQTISSQLTSAEAGNFLFNRNQLVSFFGKLKAAVSRRPHPVAVVGSEAPPPATAAAKTSVVRMSQPPLPPPRRRPAKTTVTPTTTEGAAAAAAGGLRASTRPTTQERRSTGQKVEATDSGGDENAIFIAPLDAVSFNALEVKQTLLPDIPAFARNVDLLNRYSNILPNPTSQVSLYQTTQKSGGGSGGGGGGGGGAVDPAASTYINANFVRSGDGLRAKEYIASQGPLPSTVDAFVRMIWEQNVAVVVQTTNFVESGNTKCERYFPEHAGQKLSIGMQWQVEMTAVDRRTGYTYATLVVRNRSTKEKRNIAHFWFNTWPDHEVPTAPGGASRILSETTVSIVKAVRETRFKMDQNKAPMLVHSSAGVGRAGTFIVIDQFVSALEYSLQADSDGGGRKGRITMDLLRMIGAAREDRMALVETTAQYKFAYQACLLFASRMAGAKGYILATSLESKGESISPHGANQLRTSLKSKSVYTRKFVGGAESLVFRNPSTFKVSREAIDRSTFPQQSFAVDCIGTNRAALVAAHAAAAAARKLRQQPWYRSEFTASQVAELLEGRPKGFFCVTESPEEDAYTLNIAPRPGAGAAQHGSCVEELTFVVGSARGRGSGVPVYIQVDDEHAHGGNSFASLEGMASHHIGNADGAGSSSQSGAPDDNNSTANVGSIKNTRIPSGSSETPLQDAGTGSASSARTAANTSSATAAAIASAAAVLQVVHEGIVCDMSGMNPIQGSRYQMAGCDYNLCEAEFQKLDEATKLTYVVITHPGAEKMWYSAGTGAGEPWSPPAWEWLNSSGWSRYSDGVSALLEAALSAGEDLVFLAMGAIEYRVELDNLVQENTITNYRRQVRRVARGALKTATPAWERLIERSPLTTASKLQWCRYSNEVSARLETARAAGVGSVSVQIDGRQYDIDIGSSIQTDAAGTSCFVRRVVPTFPTDAAVGGPFKPASAKARADASSAWGGAGDQNLSDAETISVHSLYDVTADAASTAAPASMFEPAAPKLKFMTGGSIERREGMFTTPAETPLPARHTLDTETWFAPTKTGVKAAEMLKRMKVGSFLVRNSGSSHGSKAISVHVGGGEVSHMHIVKSPNSTQVRLDGDGEPAFDTVVDLVHHYIRNPPNNPVTGVPLIFIPFKQEENTHRTATYQTNAVAAAAQSSVSTSGAPPAAFAKGGGPKAGGPGKGKAAYRSKANSRLLQFEAVGSTLDGIDASDNDSTDV